jgi:hypothetical protein
MTKANLKRFAWLWGALLGAVLFPAMMEVCYYCFENYLPHPRRLFPTPLISFSTAVHYLPTIVRIFGPWGAGVGCCGAMLRTGHRSLKWRLLSIGVATGTMGYLLRALWNYFQTFTVGQSDYNIWTRCVYTAAFAPLLLGASLLLFFALLMRSSPTSATKL